MSIKAQIEKDIKTYLKEKNLDAYRALVFLMSVIKNKEKEKFFELSKKGQTPERGQDILTDEEIIKILQSEIKKRKESVEAFLKGGRKDLADKEQFELDLISKYLPEQMPEEEIEKLVDEVLKEVQDKNIGVVIKEVMKRSQGRAEGSLVAKIVKGKLS